MVKSMDEYGKVYWNLIHHFAYMADEHIEYNGLYMNSRRCKLSIIVMCKILICAICYEHSKELFYDLNYVSSGFFAYTVEKHNQVNRRLNKPIGDVSVSKARRMHRKIHTGSDYIDGLNHIYNQCVGKSDIHNLIADIIDYYLVNE